MHVLIICDLVAASPHFILSGKQSTMPDINGSLFWTRLKKMVDAWSADPALFENAETVCVAIGEDDEDRPDNLRITSVQFYFFGAELPNTILIFRRDKLQVLVNHLLVALGLVRSQN